MSWSLNHPDKLSLDAYSDVNLQTQNGNGVYSRFTNVLRTPILNAKALQLLNANFINSRLQLDDNTQLMFWYYAFVSVTPVLRCIRLLPSNYIAPSGFTNFTRNRYFNTVDELVATLNLAAAAAGDIASSNPFFTANQITFFYDQNQRKVSITTTNVGTPIAPAAFDDPAVLTAMRGNTITMNTVSSSAFIQPNLPGHTMNPRIGFSRSILSRPLWFAAGVSNTIAASSTGRFETTPIEADTNPILLGAQNVSVYCSVVNGSGIDGSGRRNLLQTIPIEVAPLNINSYTCSSVEKPAMSVPNEIYEVQIELLDERGLPFFQPPSFNTQLSLAVYY